MGTRGFVGFVSGGYTKVAYNHFDSYPSALGVDVLSWLRTADLHEAAQQAFALRVVQPTDVPTPQDVEVLGEYYDGHVGESLGDGVPSWYQLLRRTQGIPAAMLAAGVIEDASEFPGDSLFAEYGYVADLDTWVFEAYVGFQKAPHTAGRFAHMEAQDKVAGRYYPVRLVGSWPMGQDLPSDEDFLAHMRQAEGIEEDED